MMMKDFLLLQMALFGIQMEYILTERDMTSMAGTMMIMVNMSQEKVGMKKIIVIKMN